MYVGRAHSLSDGDHMARSQRAKDDLKIIKNALRMKDLESTDPVYIAHREKVLGRAKK